MTSAHCIPHFQLVAFRLSNMPYTLADVIEPFQAKKINEVTELAGIHTSIASLLSLMGHVANLAPVCFGLDYFDCDSVNYKPLLVRQVLGALERDGILKGRGLEFIFVEGLFRRQLFTHVVNRIQEEFEKVFGAESFRTPHVRFFLNIKITAVLEFSRHIHTLPDFFDVYVIPTLALARCCWHDLCAADCHPPALLHAFVLL
jgi:hypothetical protein